MFIYVFASKLFIGQDRKVISNFPLDISAIENYLNKNTNYLILDRWYLVKQY